MPTVLMAPNQSDYKLNERIVNLIKHPSQGKLTSHGQDLNTCLTVSTTTTTQLLRFTIADKCIEPISLECDLSATRTRISNLFKSHSKGRQVPYLWCSTK